MKNLLTTLLALVIFYPGIAQTFSPPVGIATVTGGVVNLTLASMCGGGHKGAVWCTTTIDFTNSFTLTYQASFDQAVSGGADGIDLSFDQNITPTSINATDAYFGYYNPFGGPIDPDFNVSFGIEFDTYDNSYLPYLDDIPGVDHTAICANGIPTTPIAGPIAISPSVNNIKDGLFHDYKVTWCPTTHTLQVFYNDTLRLSSVYDYASIFTTPTSVHWGFSGGTGAACSNQLVKNIVLTVGTCSPVSSCLTNSLIINTGYNPITNTAIPGGANGASPVIDPHWKLTAVTPGIAAGIAVTPIVGLVEVAPFGNADVITPVGPWVTNPVGNPGGWISCLNSNTYNTPGTGSTAYEMTLGREFRMCSDDSIRIQCYIANDNYMASTNIDGVSLGFSQPASTSAANYNVYTYFTKTVFLTAGTHFLNFDVANYDDATLLANPTGLNVYGTVSSASGIASLVSESSIACLAYACSDCNTLSMPDTLHLCAGDTTTIHAVLTGVDSVLSYAWAPPTGLSSTTILNPLLTATTSGWYYLTVNSIIPANLAVNGDFSGGSTGFSTGYLLEPPAPTSTPGYYAVAANPNLYDAAWPVIGDHTTGTGNMLIVDGSPTPGTSFWCETISVLPNTNYIFTVWGALLHTPLPSIPVTINGSTVGTFSPGTSTWTKYQYTWNSGVVTTANICMSDLNTVAFGNDFAIDDISFQQICVTKDSTYVAICATTICDTLHMPDSLHLCFTDTATIHASVSGSDSILNYSWSPATGLSSTTIPDPVITAVTSGWYYLSINALIPGNLVVNGDFSAGNTGFSSTYLYSPPPSTILNEGYYSVYNNPNGVHSGFTSFGDHTTGTGNMLIVNGGSSASSVWCQTIPVTPNTNYDFSAWFADCSSITTGAFVPVLQFMVNGVLLGSPTPISAPVGTWVNFFSTWNSGTNTTATISIYDELTATTGNDFVIDDISFQKICTSRDSVYVKINATDTLNTHSDTSLCASSGPITLYAPASYTSHVWNTGAVTTSIVVSTSGTYWVKESGLCMLHDDTTHVTFLPSPAPITGSVAVCMGNAVMLTDPIAGGTWSSSNASVASVSSSGTVSGLVPGTVTITYSLPGACAATAPISVFPTSSTVIYDTVCNGTPYSFNGTVYTTTGTYSYTTVNAPNCDSVATLHLFVKPLPALPAVVSPAVYCQGSSSEALSALGTSLSWYTVSTGGTASFTTPVPATDIVGSTWYYVSQTVNGCEGPRVPIQVIVLPLPIAAITADRTTICLNDSAVISAAGVAGGSYLWSAPGADIITGNTSSQNIVLQFNTPGNYHIVLSVGTGNQCFALDTVVIKVIQSPVVAFYVKPNVCVDDTVVVAVSATTPGVTNCTWDFGDATIISATDAVSGGPYGVKWNAAGIHFIHMYAQDGDCKSKEVTDTVDVHALPNAAFTNLMTNDLCTGDSILLLAADKNANYMYQWSPAHFFNNNNSAEIYGKIERAGYVKLDVTTEFGCHAEDSLLIKADPCCTMLFPNAFTPNGDGKNDVFRPITTGHHVVHTFIIANRWGQIVYETVNEQIGWDGRFNGVPQDMDVYFYYVKYDCNGGTIEEKGDVNLVR